MKYKAIGEYGYRIYGNRYGRFIEVCNNLSELPITKHRFVREELITEPETQAKLIIEQFKDFLDCKDD